MKVARKRSREIQTKLIQLGYVEDISHVTCYRWVLEFEDYENQNKKRNRYTYYGYNFSFRLAEERYHNHATLVIRPSHIEVLENDSDMTDQEIIELAVADWFEEQNQLTRARNNKKGEARKK